MLQEPYSHKVFSVINYRNGVYQGLFQPNTQQRVGFGLAYAVDNHLTIASHWNYDLVSGPTLIYSDHANYMYGYWHNNLPHGFNVIRITNIIIMGFYIEGEIVGRVLVIFEKYNLSLVLMTHEKEGGTEFEEIEKRQIYSDEDFDNFLQICEWPQFEDSWKTLIKFISNHLLNQSQEKSHKTKLRLINGVNYRYGFDEGLAIIFDDDYNIISAGLHKKAKLSSLGIRFLPDQVIEEGNFQNHQIFSFHQTHKPEEQIGRFYSNYLLKGVYFVNAFINNPAQLIFHYFQDLTDSHFFKRLLSGQISNRKLDITLNSPVSKKRTTHSPSPNRRHKQQAGKIVKKNLPLYELTPEKSPSSSHKKISPFNSKKINSYESNFKLNSRQLGEDSENVLEERERLEKYRQEIQMAISRKQFYESSPKQNQNQGIFEWKNYHQKNREQKKDERLIHKKPVLIFEKNMKKDDLTTRRKRSRSPIFTPEKSPTEHNQQYFDTSSPFNKKIKQKLLKERQKNQRKYFYQPIQNKNQPNNGYNRQQIANYQSPHQAFQFSREEKSSKRNQVFPISMKNQVYMSNNSKKGEQKTKRVSDEGLLQPKKTISFGPEMQDQIFKQQKKVSEQKVPFYEKISNNEVYLKNTRQKQKDRSGSKKNDSYLELHKRKVSPRKEQKYQSKKYDELIRGFNDFNKPYHIISSPKTNVIESNTEKSFKKYKYVFD